MGVITYPGQEKVKIYPGGGFIIDRIQTGQLQWADGGDNTVSCAINAVDMSNTALIWNGCHYTTNDLRHQVNHIWISSATRVCGERRLTAEDVTTFFSVVEYYAGSIKSVQRGFINLNENTQGTATISPVDTNKAHVAHLGFCSADTDDYKSRVRFILTNETTVTMTAGATTSGDGSFEVVEFY